jgi:nucleotide-binding universal stress UspA family protein
MSRYRHIVIPIDLTDESIRTIEQGRTLAREHGAMLHILYVLSSNKLWFEHDPELLTRFAEVQKALMEISRSLGPIEHEVVLRIGEFDQQLRQYCDRVHPDLMLVPSTMKGEPHYKSPSQFTAPAPHVA